MGDHFVGMAALGDCTFGGSAGQVSRKAGWQYQAMQEDIPGSSNGGRRINMLSRSGTEDMAQLISSRTTL